MREEEEVVLVVGFLLGDCACALVSRLGRCVGLRVRST